MLGCFLTVALLSVWLAGRESGAGWFRWTLTLLLPLLISGYGLKKRSLDTSGAGLAVVVGFLLTAASGCFSASLIIFFLTSSRLTKWKAAEKKKLEDGYREGLSIYRLTPTVVDLSSQTLGGQRNWVQVVCNGGVASGCGLIYLGVVGMAEVPLRYDEGGIDVPSLLSLAILAALGCCCGDTWASEVGSVIGGRPRLITTFRPAPTGTNGGVTVVGVACSIAGGAVIGLTHYISLLLFWREGESRVNQIELVVVGAASGLIGSLIDSLLGATLQFSGYSQQLGRVVNSPGPGVRHVAGRDILDNHTVNLLSSLITAFITPLLWTSAHSLLG